MPGKRSFPLRMYISALFAVILLLLGGLLSVLGRHQLELVVRNDTATLTRAISHETVTEVSSLIALAGVAVHEVSSGPAAIAGSLKPRMAALDSFVDALAVSPAIGSAYVGYADGDFFDVRRVGSDAQRLMFSAPAATRYVVEAIDSSRGTRTARYIYVDVNRHVIGQSERPELLQYDPRQRAWYQKAMAKPGLVRTPPYAYFATPEVGITLAVSTPGHDAVAACDISLSVLRETLLAQRSTPGTVLAMASPDGKLIASDLPGQLDVTAEHDGTYRLAELAETGNPVLARVEDTLHGGGDPTGHDVLSLDGEHWYTSVSPLSVSGSDLFYLVSATPEADLVRQVQHIRMLGLGLALLVIAVSLLATWLIVRQVTKPLERLDAIADAMRRFDFKSAARVDSRISEVSKLAATLDEMKLTIRRFLGAIHAVATEPQFERLLMTLLDEVLDAAHADAGVLYLANDNTTLKPACALDRNRIAALTLPRALALADVPDLIRAAVHENGTSTGPLSNADIERTGLQTLYPMSAGETCHAAVIPLVNRQRDLIGVFLLLRREPMQEAQFAFVTALTKLFVSAIETHELIDAQRNLFESFVRVIATAIDAKSPHTGGHCSRLPELVKMFAQAACETTSGPYRDFHLDERQWQELHIAAWLHDCGKITTPEYVMEKATKLETLYDRIHEIRMRFEVLKCEAQIDCLKAVAAGADPQQAEARRDALLRELDDDFAFVAACNHGSEFMDEASIERLRRIGERTWIRTIDNRLGVSRDELKQMEKEPAQPLPVAEKLLADRPEHRIDRTGPNPAAAGNVWGFRMAVPELLYNRGELHNLSVPRGTLSAEERFKINEHIIQTIVMLEQLPFPRRMRNIPEIAGGHHEKMDGTGYPKGITRADMSPLARMMAIADIFEALTAADRPYKRGKTLSESLRIMAGMKQTHHIDPDLFDLFLTSGVYLEYARRFMQPAQIDEVNIDDYLDARAQQTHTESGPACAMNG